MKTIYTTALLSAGMLMAWLLMASNPNTKSGLPLPLRPPGPTAVCQNVTLNASSNCTATTAASALDGGSTGNGITFSHSPAGPYALGVTNVTLTVTDSANLSSTCTAFVTVIDITPPSISCPSNVVTVNDSGQCAAAVTYPAPIAADNCPGFAILQTTGLASGANFPVGTTTNVYTATDASGNTASCSFTVAVSDNTPPNAICQDITVTLDSMGHGIVLGTAADGGSFDNCGATSAQPSQATADTNDLGYITLVLTVTDANGNTSTCVFVAYVQSECEDFFTSSPSGCYDLHQSMNGNTIEWNVEKSTDCDSGAIQLIWVVDHADLPNYAAINPRTCQAIVVKECTLRVYSVDADAYCKTISRRPNTALPGLQSCQDSCSVSCYGGNDAGIEVTVTGSFPPFTYLWSTGATTQSITNLTAGTYSVTVTDALGNTDADTVIISQPPPLVCSGTVSAYSCGYAVSCSGAADGNIDLTVTGGCGAYSYQWSNGATTQDISGLTAGIYTVSVLDGNSCATTCSFNLGQPTQIIPTVSTMSYPCICDLQIQNYAIMVAVAGGCGPYSYTWTGPTPIGNTNNPSGLLAGTYNVTITDANACTASQSVAVP